MSEIRAMNKEMVLLVVTVDWPYAHLGDCDFKAETMGFQKASLNDDLTDLKGEWIFNQ